MDARWSALILLTVARLSHGYQFQSMASVAPLLLDDIAITYADIGFLIGLYFLPGIVLAIPGGLLGQRFGDKRIVLIGLALMGGGGVGMALAESHAVLVAGRLISGIGAVLLNVLMTKMIIDWFAGREIALAMAVLINAYPIGIGLALLTLGWLADHAGWQLALHVAAATALAALVLIVALYRPHPNDRSVPGSEAPSTARPRTGDLARVGLAGAMWALYNGGFAILLGFTPLLLTARGATTAEAGVAVSIATWLIVGSIQAGGIVAAHVRAAALMLVGTGTFAVGLLLLPFAPPVSMLILIGLFGGLPVAVMLSLPAAVLRPEDRGAGMGVFYTCLYVGVAVLPPIAGWLRDLTADPAVPLYFGAAMLAAILPLYGLFRAQERLATRLRR